MKYTYIFAAWQTFRQVDVVMDATHASSARREWSWSWSHLSVHLTRNLNFVVCELDLKKFKSSDVSQSFKWLWIKVDDKITYMSLDECLTIDSGYTIKCYVELLRHQPHVYTKHQFNCFVFIPNKTLSEDDTSTIERHKWIRENG